MCKSWCGHMFPFLWGSLFRKNITRSYVKCILIPPSFSPFSLPPFSPSFFLFPLLLQFAGPHSVELRLSAQRSFLVCTGVPYEVLEITLGLAACMAKVQGKHITHCTIYLAPKLSFTFPTLTFPFDDEALAIMRVGMGVWSIHLVVELA